jgi:hypothetical protein
MSDNDPLLGLLKEFISENKDEHSEIRRCMNSIKSELNKIKVEFAGGGERCNTLHADLEIRLREVEKLLPLEKLPEKFEILAKSMYKSIYKLLGGLTVIAILLGWIVPMILKRYV